MPREVICELCGGKFFAHSLPHHRKSCEKKVRNQALECPYCGQSVTQLEMDSHILSCRAAKAAGAMPTGQSARLRQRLEDGRRGSAAAASGRLISQQAPGRSTPDRERLAGPGPLRTGGPVVGLRPHASEGQLLTTAPAAQALFPVRQGGAGIPAEQPGDLLGLVPCRICGRTFTSDRVAKHQAICQKASAKKRTVFHAEEQRIYTEGGSGGSVIGMGKTCGRGRGGGAIGRGSRSVGGRPPRGNSMSAPRAPLPPRSNWREKSMAFREAVRNARRFTNPGAGTSAGYSRGGAYTAGLPGRSYGAAASTRGEARPGQQQQQARVGHRGRPAGGGFGPGASGTYPALRTQPRGAATDRQPADTSLAAARRAVPGAGGASMSRAARQHAAAWEAREAANTAAATATMGAPAFGGGIGHADGGWGGSFGSGLAGGGGLAIGNSNATSAENPLVFGGQSRRR